MPARHRRTNSASDLLTAALAPTVGWSLLIIGLCFSAHADNPSTIEKLAQQLNQEKEQLLQKEQQKRNVLGELYSVNKNLKKINNPCMFLILQVLDTNMKNYYGFILKNLV